MSGPIANAKLKNTAGDKREEEILTQHLENSRKRHLSPTTFRGDQAVDRLLAQELSASPLLKKTKALPTIGADVGPSAEGMALSANDFFSYMEKNVTKQLTEVTERVAENTKKIDDQGATIRANADSIAAMKIDIQNLKVRPPAYASIAATPASNSPTHMPSPEDDAQFMLARRSIRIWPVLGSSVQDLWRNSGQFLATNLGLTNVRESHIESVSRPAIPSGLTAKNEVLIVFKDADVRDTVIGASAKLAMFVDEERRPTAGIRIEVPRRLRGAFSTLFKFGQQLRLRHGEGTRKHIKFDDVGRTLFLNIKLPRDESWSRVSVEMARRNLKARETLTENALERRLDLTGPMIQNPRQRAASTSAVPAAPSDHPMPMWTGRASLRSVTE